MSLTSSILNAANRVIYGSPTASNKSQDTVNPSASEQSNANPVTSTPIPKNAKNTPDIQNSAVLEICKQIKGTNDRLDEIVKRLSKLDDIENRLNKIDNTMAEFQTRIRNVESKTADFEQSVTFVSAKCDEFNDKCNTIDEMKTELENQASVIDSLTNGMQSLQTSRDELPTCNAVL